MFTIESKYWGEASIYIYICLFPLNVKTAELIGPVKNEKFCPEQLSNHLKMNYF